MPIKFSHVFLMSPFEKGGREGGIIWWRYWFGYIS